MKAGLEDYTWHCNRHTFISRLIMAGVDIRTAQEFAGHKILAMTMCYAHLAPEHKREAMDKLDAFRLRHSSGATDTGTFGSAFTQGEKSLS